MAFAGETSRHAYANSSSPLQATSGTAQVGWTVSAAIMSASSSCSSSSSSSSSSAAPATQEQLMVGGGDLDFLASFLQDDMWAQPQGSIAATAGADQPEEQGQQQGNYVPALTGTFAPAESVLASPPLSPATDLPGGPELWKGRPGPTFVEMSPSSSLANNNLEEDNKYALVPTTAQDEGQSGRPGDAGASSTDKPCLVCGAAAGRHTYYGGQVCVSCRGFFRRSVQSNCYSLFACKVGQRCPVDFQSRKTCKWCRFQRCTAAGMRTSMVMSNEQRRQRIVRRNNKNAVQAMKVQARLAFTFTEEEREQYDSMFQSLMTYIASKYVDFLVQHREHVGDFIASRLPDGRPGLRYVQTMAKADEQMIANFAFGLDDMADLTPYDRMSLIHGNCDMVLGMGYATFSADVDEDLFVASFVRCGQDKVRREPAARDLLREVQRQWGPRRQQMKRRSALSREQLSPDYKRQIGLVGSVLRDQPDMASDKVVSIVSCLIMLFSPQVADLQHPAAVEKINYRYLCLLHRYLSMKYAAHADRAQRCVQSVLGIGQACRALYAHRKHYVE